MTDKILSDFREIVRQKLYSLNPYQECEIPIAISAIRYCADLMANDWPESTHPADYLDEFANQLEKTFPTNYSEKRF